MHIVIQIPDPRSKVQDARLTVQDPVLKDKDTILRKCNLTETVWLIL